MSQVKRFINEITMAVSCHLWDYIERSSSLTNHFITSGDSRRRIAHELTFGGKKSDTLALIHLVGDRFSCVLKVAESSYGCER